LVCIFLAAALGVLSDCKSGGPIEAPLDEALNNPIFPGANVVETGVPAFNDTVSSTPGFTWVQTKCRLVFVGVFAQRIIVKDRKILNPGDIVWAWHSGLGTGREGSIIFTDGVDVNEGILQTGVPPHPLQGGRGYNWAVWAWDDDGLKIAWSSREMFFVVR
jgi:hypothetical protein